MKLKDINLPRTIRALCACTLVTLIAGCVTAPPPVDKAALTKLKRVGVISVVGREYSRTYVGLVEFLNEKEKRDISDWAIDEKYQEQIGAEVERQLKATVVKAPYSAAEFSPANDRNGPWGLPIFWGPNWSKIETASRNFCAANTLDGLIVLAKAETPDFLGQTNQDFGGLGAYVRGPGNSISVLHIAARLALLDCSTGKPIATQAVGTSSKTIFGKTVITPLTAAISPDLARLPVAQWSPAQQQQLAETFSELPTGIWGQTLQGLISPQD